MRPRAPKRVRTLARKVHKTGQYEWRNYWYTRPIEPDTVMYEAFAGRGLLCNPEALFRALLEDSEFSHLHHVWALRDPQTQHIVPDEFASHPRVRFVRLYSRQYYRALATSKYLVNNATFPPEFIKRAEQVYVNTWHGTPLKTMGYDTPEGGVGASNVTRNLVSADYLLSSSPFMTERMYEQAYRLRNIYTGKVITEGFPRIDRQVAVDQEAVRRELRKAGVQLRPGAKTVLYAPTWRGRSFQAPTNDAEMLGQRIRELTAQLPEDVQVLLKVHQQVYSYAAEHPDLQGLLIPNRVPTNQVLGLTDVLVTDYSSIFFDFLVTDRPIIFFTPDRDHYDDSRGRYFGEEELPGPTTASIGRLADLVRATGTGTDDDPETTHSKAYAQARGRFVPRDDGSAAARIIDIVWRGKHEPYDVQPIRHDGRPRLLVYAGGLRPNGITASVMNLLANLDYEALDVSVFYNSYLAPDARAAAAALPAAVRLIPRVGGITPSKILQRQRQRLQTEGIDAPGLHLAVMDRVFEDEWRRCFGGSQFDHIVDFSGYAPFWSFLMSRGKAKTRSIWLHSDMKADQLRQVDGEHPHEENLRAVFSTYALYDKLVSVSASLAKVNAEKLDLPDGDSRFTFARNTINHRRIRRLAYGIQTEHPATPVSDPVPLTSLPETMAALAQRYGVSALQEEISRRGTVEEVIPPSPGTKTFVAVGRLSPEKNYARLIRAFDLLHQRNAATRLIIVGGGPLETELRDLTWQLGLHSAVHLAGQQQNPYVIMAQSDCLVLSSDYEGQPMVFLEALTLGLPVVTTQFPSVQDSLPVGTGLVVSQTAEALAEGMEVALRGEVPNPPFDPEDYNRQAMAEFYRAIGLEV